MAFTSHEPLQTKALNRQRLRRGERKQDKREANRALRKATHQKLGTVSDETVLPVMREVSDVWNTAKEGKRFFDPAGDPKRMRK